MSYFKLFVTVFVSSSLGGHFSSCCEATLVMDFGGEAGFAGGGNVVPDGGGGGGFDCWGALGLSDQSVWATEDDYRNWNAAAETPPYSGLDGRQAQNRAGSEPPNKKSRNSQGGDAHVIVPNNNRSKAIGKMFFKTKLCCKFRAGVCPYITNCNFAHGIEELRKPPPNWQEIVAAHDVEHAAAAATAAVAVPVEPREEHQIPIIRSPDSRGETQRSYKGRHCKKFYTEEGCPYGDNCTFLHDEQSRARESVAISVTPTVGPGYGTNPIGVSQKPSNWKTRICNKWETTGYCPFGNKCHFAHGIAELHKYGGGLVDTDGKDLMSALPDTKPGGGGVTTKVADATVPSTLSVPHMDCYMGLGGPVQRSSGIPQRPGQRAFQKWKGPDKISKIYGDWIDDIE